MQQHFEFFVLTIYFSIHLIGDSGNKARDWVAFSLFRVGESLNKAMRLQLGSSYHPRIYGHKDMLSCYCSELLVKKEVREVAICSSMNIHIFIYNYETTRRSPISSRTQQT